MTASDYPRATQMPAPTTPPPMAATTPTFPSTPTQLPAPREPVTLESLIDLRAKYRAGLIVLGEFLAALDRFLDGQDSDKVKVKVKTVEVKTVEVKDK